MTMHMISIGSLRKQRTHDEEGALSDYEDSLGANDQFFAHMQAIALSRRQSQYRDDNEITETPTYQKKRRGLQKLTVS